MDVRNSDVQETERVYLGNLLNKCLVDVDVCNFVSQDLHVHGAQWLA